MRESWQIAVERTRAKAGPQVKLAAVLGDPVAHSRSPALHGFWMKEHRIKGAYLKLQVPKNALGEALEFLRKEGFAGCNLTVPLKEAAMPLMDEIGPNARTIGAVNTVIIKHGKFRGRNTDAEGFIESLRAAQGDVTPWLARPLVLGAGGAARAVLHALHEAGAKEIMLANRTRENAEALKAWARGPVEIVEWDEVEAALPQASMLVNTTVLGMEGKPPLAFSLQGLPCEALVADIVYAPLVTPLLAEARAAGHPVVEGIGMLLYQAVPAFEAWFGVRPAVTPALQEAVLAA